MTDRVKGFIVVLEKDMREDDTEAVVNSLKMTKGVISVEPVKSEIGDGLEKIRVRMDLLNKISQLIIDETN